MDKDAKDRWVKALRSGEYKQCVGQLCVVDDKGEGPSFCCLGVLCEVKELKYTSDNNTRCYYTKDSGSSSELQLPNTLRKSLSISNENELSLTRMNDREVRFNEIADWIEENL